MKRGINHISELSENSPVTQHKAKELKTNSSSDTYYGYVQPVIDSYYSYRTTPSDLDENETPCLNRTRKRTSYELQNTATRAFEQCTLSTPNPSTSIDSTEFHLQYPSSIRSVHSVASQQSQDTDDDGFQLSQNATYERVASPSHGRDSGRGDDDLAVRYSQCISSQSTNKKEFPEPSRNLSIDNRRQSRGLTPGVTPPPAFGILSTSLSSMSAGTAITPEVTGLEIVDITDDGSTPASSCGIIERRPPLPLNSKRVILIRHGESEYNKACSLRGTFHDPEIFDAPLTEAGILQARSLRPFIRDLLERSCEKHGIPLFVCSPLRRALQTVDNMNPNPNNPLNLTITELNAEWLRTTGDVGNPVSKLKDLFPQHKEKLAALPEHWWYSKDDKVNCALTRQLNSMEPLPELQRRVGNFKGWLRHRPERHIIVVGHANFFKTFLKANSFMKNCEFKIIQFT
uniref:Uncharacterized protein n=1 Tax=Polytomella parva TaxID=51329 RepID=A0A7S0YAA6_9CHLO|mmetsp:Transcript_12938/g.23011  ORF Transcript_12938/g.23011 Transcript_12938/m.23011 type:complete len:458 (+) Transcript_12938:129-1502(+)|eukprot:CAMPEP_0175041276 /NCGR_PEP_ID=MMETSP0052_2-20121109/1814_1 /TAXON_ID=51329 ORGANISM="Polytomella parva, Strain SAG 63-3" /NCGR_SAMPLE_ID=MMETSP0052_2 /ASSEMBLY_ACC=CAM_ASM_000194 /LENGTH=457 /DNA_ID=CAMNT_0016303751 /DNA_START=59 /DNA_END=1432 /DNA_ORIENTATION=-